MSLNDVCSRIVAAHPYLYRNLSRTEIIKKAVEYKEALVLANGCLCTWTPAESTGTSPKDTLIVNREEIRNNIDWDSPANIPLDPRTFEMLWADAMEILKTCSHLFVTEKTMGANATYTMPVKTVSPSPLIALFTMNMFRPLPLENFYRSIYHNRGFTLIVLPKDKVNAGKYQGRLRTLPSGKTSDMVIAVDFTNRLGLIYGNAYLGSIKSLMFTVMNYFLPLENILPLRCAASENKNGDSAIFLGPSGSGKTTLSADPSRILIGDDEHGWNSEGIANLEYGCYAKLINIDPDLEPDLYQAVFHKAPYPEHGVIVENAMTFPDGSYDLHDERLTRNSRAALPLSYLSNTKPLAMGKHPRVIVLLTNDANGVLPPVARLNLEQTLLWFLMGYTGKPADTETGVINPIATFSSFIGQPVIPYLPQTCMNMLRNNIQKYGSHVYLINTGWSGGHQGVGNRMDIRVTRTILNAVLDGLLQNVQYRHDKLFHMDVPLSCPGVAAQLLNPLHAWPNTVEYQVRAAHLAKEFSHWFDKMYAHKGIDETIKAQCPGK